MSGSPGTRLGPYELVSRIGAGGMGEVWRARDTRLDRDVAVKMLPAEFANDAQLRIRFAREARTIARLDHPHICALFDVGEDYLVMELLEGESLAERIDRGPLPVAEAMKYGAQIADALDRAHRAGVIHRDLKPGNVMITRAGAKLVDFGLAKSVAVNDTGVTMERPLTTKGVVIGTFQYMAPEQLEGAELDARTDIFALGEVLYEMITGRPPFQGPTREALITAILRGEPRPVTESQPLAPPALEHVIAKCLSKKPDDRWQSAHDIAEELRWIGSGGSQPATQKSAVRRRIPFERLAWPAALLACLAVIVWMFARPKPQAEAIEAAITFDENLGADAVSGPPALSPDGKWLVYAARPVGAAMSSLWVRAIDRGPARVIEGSEFASVPAWSPDGRFIVYRARGEVRKIPVTGGQSEMLVPLTSSSVAWGRQDVILYTTGEPEVAVRGVAASGGGARVVLRGADIGASRLVLPQFLPDGNHFIILATGGKVAERRQEGIWLATLDGSQPPRFLTETSVNAAYVEPGWLLFVREGVLRALRLDRKKLAPVGEPVTIAPVQTYDSWANFCASDSGMLLYQPMGSVPLSELVLMNRKGEPLRRFGEPAQYYFPAVSPDGRRVAVDRSRADTTGDIWIIDGTSSTRLTFDDRNESSPIWSPDGREIIYGVQRSPESVELRRQRLGEASRPVFETEAGRNVAATDWSDDGRYLAMEELDRLFDVLVWSLAERKWISIAATPANEAKGNFSPDGKWILYQSDESGRMEIYAQPFPPNGAKFQVSTGGGMTPRWLRSGEISWVDYANRLWVVKAETTPAFRVDTPVALFSINQRFRYWYEYDAAPDGNFLVNVPLPRPSQPMTLLVNWTQRFSK
jgi:eukaryotic-like serine/threonine-protein kinase